MLNNNSKAAKQAETADLVAQFLSQGGRIHTVAPRKPWRR
jgi:hypothetical protein